MEIADRPRVERGEEATESIQRIIQREDLHGGYKLVGQVLGKVMNDIVTKVKATAGSSLAEKNKEYIKRTIIEGFYDRFTSTNHTTISSLDTVII